MPTDIRSKLLALVSATLAGATLSACSSSTQQAPAASAHTPTMQQGAGQAGSCSGHAAPAAGGQTASCSGHPPAATPAAAPAAGGQAASCSATGSCGAAQPADAGAAR